MEFHVITQILLPLISIEKMLEPPYTSDHNQLTNGLNVLTLIILLTTEDQSGLTLI